MLFSFFHKWFSSFFVSDLLQFWLYQGTLVAHSKSWNLNTKKYQNHFMWIFQLFWDTGDNIKYLPYTVFFIFESIKYQYIILTLMFDEWKTMAYENNKNIALFDLSIFLKHNEIIFIMQIMQIYDTFYNSLKKLYFS